MSRRKQIKKREVMPDPVYNSELVSRFINRMMWKGKKGCAEKILYDAIDIMNKKMKSEGLEVFEKAVENVKPQVEVRSRRVGGATYQVPVEVSAIRQRTLALRWIITNARNRSERGMANKLAGELLDALNNTGSSMKKKEDVFKMAESNKAFVHYRW